MGVKHAQWKRVESKIAQLLGGTRVPVSGRQRGDAPDIEHEWLSIECKAFKSLPAWLKDAVAQARASVRGAQLPIVVLHQNGQQYGDDLVVIPLHEFREWFGDWGVEPLVDRSQEEAGDEQSSIPA
jgi:hypothetical protein